MVTSAPAPARPTTAPVALCANAVGAPMAARNSPVAKHRTVLRTFRVGRLADGLRLDGMFLDRLLMALTSFDGVLVMVHGSGRALFAGERQQLPLEAVIPLVVVQIPVVPLDFAAL